MYLVGNKRYKKFYRGGSDWWDRWYSQL